VLIRPEEGERLPRGERYHRVLVELPELEALELRFPPGFVVEPHVHDDHADSFYVLAGEIEFTIGEEVVRAGPGTWFSAPRGTRHGFRSVGEGELRVLNIHAPRTGFVAELREP
jgi:quercetin dioxygenase-like cupin family protein